MTKVHGTAVLCALSFACNSHRLSDDKQQHAGVHDVGIIASETQQVVVHFQDSFVAGSEAPPDVQPLLTTFDPDPTRACKSGDSTECTATGPREGRAQKLEADRLELVEYLREQRSADDRPVNVVLYLASMPAFDATRLRSLRADSSPQTAERAALIEARIAEVGAIVEAEHEFLRDAGFEVTGHSWSTGAVFAAASSAEILDAMNDPRVYSVQIGDNGQWLSTALGYTGTETRDRTNATALSALAYDGNSVSHHGNAAVRVGILDSGIPNTNHPAFIDYTGGPSRWKGVYRCGSTAGCTSISTSQPGSGDTHSHTIASLVGSTILQGQDPAFAASSSAASVRSFGAGEVSLYMYDWESPSMNVLAGIVSTVNQALVNNIDILNMSFGSNCAGPVSDVNGACSGARDALGVAYEAGIVLIASTGNNGPGSSTILFPALRSEVIAVGALDASNQFAAYHDLLVDSLSSRGPVSVADAYGQPSTVAGVDILAPHRMSGYSSRPSTYSFSDCGGTSCSSPTAAGMVAQMIDGFDALGWTALIADAGRMSNVVRLMGDASNGVSANGESNSLVSATSGYGRLIAHVPSGADLASPWGFGSHAPTIYEGQVLRYAVWSTGPESAAVTEWKWAVTWDEPNLAAMQSDITISVEDACGAAWPYNVMGADTSYANTKRIHLGAGSIGGYCLEMVIRAHRTPAAGQRIYMSDYFHGGSTNLH